MTKELVAFDSPQVAELAGYPELLAVYYDGAEKEIFRDRIFVGSAGEVEDCFTTDAGAAEFSNVQGGYAFIVGKPPIEVIADGIHCPKRAGCRKVRVTDGNGFEMWLDATTAELPIWTPR